MSNRGGFGSGGRAPECRDVGEARRSAGWRHARSFVRRCDEGIPGARCDGAAAEEAGGRRQLGRQGGALEIGMRGGGEPGVGDALAGRWLGRGVERRGAGDTAVGWSRSATAVPSSSINHSEKRDEILSLHLFCNLVLHLLRIYGTSSIFLFSPF
jgi:hypothetical protein